ncbi:MAG TPA: hypothetical protein VHW45_05555 [Candidatus Sulfotelmatobacter sp.]|nr:hypothetical protein [Candidatus Sulfotelmatobacter sp.]
MKSSIAAFVVLALISFTGCGSGGSNGGGGSDPPPSKYAISGSVSGLSGIGLVLQDNDGGSLSISANGTFTFPTSVTGGSAYNVIVFAQPSNPAQMCGVANGSGTANANITNISVTCTTATTTYTIGGLVSGLSGSGLVLQNNGGDDLAISANGSFTFATAIPAGTSYNVIVKTQPSSPAQTCSVTNGSGIANAIVTNVSVACSTTTTTYTIGGSVSGLSGSGLILQNNGSDNLSVSANGNFTFLTPIAAGGGYSVTVLTQPSNPAQTCTVSNGSGTTNANVTNVSISCTTNASTYTIGGTLSGLSSGSVVLQDNGSDNLTLNASGTFKFATPIAAGGSYTVTVKTQPASQFCSVANGGGTANADVTNVQVSCTATGGKTIPLTFFGTSLNFFTIWPPTDGQGQVATLGSLRLWDDKVKWGQINTAEGKYDWTLLDSYMTMAQSMNLNVLYTFGDTPDYAGTIPTGFGIHCLAPSDYSCSPPNDVNTDGTGTDKFFSDFVTALVTRYKGQISYYDLWNEPDCPCYFAGTQQQMVRMNQDASNIIHSIDPNAQTLSPSGHVWTMSTWFDPYIAAGGAATFDIVNMHMRGNGDALNVVPESFLSTYANIVSDVKAQGLGDRPLWDSEHGIKADENVTDPDTLAGYLARELVLRAGVGLVRQYLYSWDDNPPVGVQGTLAGTAWDTEAGWLLGHTISPCSASGTVYTCNLDDGQIVWDTAQSCSNGVCTTSNYTFPSSYAFQTDLTGKKMALSGKTVPIGYKPLFLTAN